MARVEMSDNLVEFDGKVRVEDCAMRQTAVATPEFMAAHPALTVGGYDANGQVIVMGQELTFINFTAPRGWAVYEHLPAPDAETIVLENWPDVIDGVPYRWLPHSYHATRDAAETVAQSLV